MKNFCVFTFRSYYFVHNIGSIRSLCVYTNIRICSYWNQFAI